MLFDLRSLIPRDDFGTGFVVEKCNQGTGIKNDVGSFFQSDFIGFSCGEFVAGTEAAFERASELTNFFRSSCGFELSPCGHEFEKIQDLCSNRLGKCRDFLLEQ